jgi:hypothetical protein
MENFYQWLEKNKAIDRSTYSRFDLESKTGYLLSFLVTRENVYELLDISIETPITINKIYKSLTEKISKIDER